MTIWMGKQEGEDLHLENYSRADLRNGVTSIFYEDNSSCDEKKA